jgi:hypothetical protein
MTGYQFDDSLKNIIRDHRSPVPDDMWKRIIQKKDKDRKGFLFFFRWFAILIVPVCVGGYLLMTNTKRELKPVNHDLVVPDQQVSQATDHLNKEGVNKEKNSMRTVPQPVVDKKGSHHLKSIGELKEKEGNFSSFSDKKTVSKQAENGVQNPSLQKDSLAGEKEDSVMNKPVAGIKLPTVIKPAVNKSPVDSSQKATVKKTQKDAVTDKKWYLDIYASPDFPIDHTAYTSSNYINEQMKLSYTIGLRINRAFGKHFSGKIGIQFSQINFKTDSSALPGLVNHLKSFDLPVLVGYSFGTEKLKMTITVGGIANLSSSYTGDPLADFFKTNTGFSLYGGFNIEKQVNQKISIFMEPYYRYRLTSMTLSTVEFNKFIDVIGLSIGARYYFLKPTKK